MDPLGTGSGSLGICRAQFGTPALDRFPSDFILGTFKKISRDKPNLVNAGEKHQAFYMKTYCKHILLLPVR
jgi:hypothetical protein